MDFVPFEFMAIRFAFVSADINAIPADMHKRDHAWRRMLGYPHQWKAFIIVIASLHAWPPGSRLCQLDTNAIIPADTNAIPRI